MRAYLKCHFRRSLSLAWSSSAFSPGPFLVFSLAKPFVVIGSIVRVHFKTEKKEGVVTFYCINYHCSLESGKLTVGFEPTAMAGWAISPPRQRQGGLPPTQHRQRPPLCPSFPYMVERKHPRGCWKTRWVFWDTSRAFLFQSLLRLTHNKTLKCDQRTEVLSFFFVCLVWTSMVRQSIVFKAFIWRAVRAFSETSSWFTFKKWVELRSWDSSCAVGGSS